MSNELNTIDEAIEILEGIKAGKGVEVEAFGGWIPRQSTGLPNFGLTAYRLKPEPLECWVNVYGDCSPSAWPTEDRAKCAAGPSALRTAVHMREVES